MGVSTAFSLRRLAAVATFVLLSQLSFGQILKQKHLELIKARSETWNKAFNSRDTTAFYGLFNPGITVSSASGSRTTEAAARQWFRGRFRQRPDVTWMNRTMNVEVSDLGQLAYETGEWAEAWTDPQDKSKNRIIGKYWLMWKFENNAWTILSATYTPLSCATRNCLD
ncbi:nuclear transport factor 2 family protein [Hymenobacter aquaticus]|uniref:Nuclear transport factor 2 family protein n=1 Tax=Hymenobacter aquaticus TaxID=1867101 RepID=A0A4Z0Q5V0_9BACT|nr:nuclear transport factor 2 family protein [Hymenobacter aquaticus]TGE25460.1 nuclear transport factor 2 family protein [Hymenobacter aquaticus]